VAVIYREFELRDAFVVDACLFQVLAHLLVVRRGQQRADGEQVALHAHEHFVDARHRFDRASDADRRVQFVDVAVRFDARMVFRNASTAEESRVARVARLAIDLHSEDNVRLFFRMRHEMRDITIIGGGPTGIFALFYAGMRGATAQIVDALADLGGQLTALYPEKYIFDVGGFPKVLAKDLVRSLAEQASQFHQPIHLAQRIVALEEGEGGDGHFTLVTDTDRFPSRSIV